MRRLREVGHTSELSKEQPPSLRLQTLGVEIDLQAGRMRLLDSKRVRYAERVRRLLVGTICTRHELVSLLGGCRLRLAATRCGGSGSMQRGGRRGLAIASMATVWL